MNALEQRILALQLKVNYDPRIPESVEVLRERVRRLKEPTR